MSDPISAVITGLVGTLSAYMTYKVGMEQAKTRGVPAPQKTEEVQKGEHVESLLKEFLQKHGQAMEKQLFDAYLLDHKSNKAMIELLLNNLFQRDKALMSQMEALVQQRSAQSSTTSINVKENLGIVAGSIQNLHQTISVPTKTALKHGKLRIELNATISCSRGFLGQKKWDPTAPGVARFILTDLITGEESLYDLFRGELVYVNDFGGLPAYVIPPQGLEVLKRQALKTIQELYKQGWKSRDLTELSRRWEMFLPIPIRSSTEPGFCSNFTEHDLEGVE